MPDHILLSPAFPAAFQSTLTALTLPSVRIVLDALDAIRAIVGHDSLHDPSDQYLSPAQHASFPAYASAIRAVVEAHATQLVQLLLDVLVAGGEDEPHNVLTILRLLSIQFPAVLAQTVPPSVERLEQRAAGLEEKQEFLGRFTTCVASFFPFLPLVRECEIVRECESDAYSHADIVPPPPQRHREPEPEPGQGRLHVAPAHLAAELRARARPAGPCLAFIIVCSGTA